MESIASFVDWLLLRAPLSPLFFFSPVLFLFEMCFFFPAPIFLFYSFFRAKGKSLNCEEAVRGSDSTCGALYHSIPNDTALHCRYCSRHSPSQNTQGKIVSTHQLSFFLYYTVKFLCFPVALHISSFLCVVNTLTRISIPACVCLNKSCV